MEQAVDCGTLLVHHVIVSKGALSDAEMLLLHPLLRLLNRTAQHGMGELLPLLQAKTIHDGRDPVGAEEPHQIVLEGDVEP